MFLISASRNLRILRPFPQRLLHASVPRCSVEDKTRECYITYLTQEDEQGIALVHLNRAEKRNALGRTLIQQMTECLNTLQTQPHVRVVVVQSQVPNIFCAGADLKERATMSESEVSAFVQQLGSTMTLLQRLPVPTIAALDGFALGGGFEMALSCDVRLAGPQARMGLPETQLAIIPGAGGTQRLSRLIGPSLAKELIFTGRILTTGEAKRLGVVSLFDSFESKGSTGNSNTKKDEGPTAMVQALALAKVLRLKGPLALRMAKQAIDRGSDVNLETGLLIEQECYAQLIPTQDRVEALKAFQEKRPPRFNGY